MLEEGVEHRVKDDTGDFLAALDRVRSVHQHFRLDDRHQLLLLTQGSVPRQRMHICTHASGTRSRIRDRDDSAPFRETRTHIVILPETIPQTVKPLGDGFVGRAGEGLRAGINLDAGKDALDRKSLGEQRAIGTLLTDRFVIHDDAADELGGARGGKEHFPVGAPALLRSIGSRACRIVLSTWGWSRRPRESLPLPQPASVRPSPDLWLVMRVLPGGRALPPSKAEIAGWEAFQPDHIASIAGCISNEPAFAIELRDFK